MKKITVTVLDDTYSRLLAVQLSIKQAGVRPAPLGAAVDACVKAAALAEANSKPKAIPDALPAETVYRAPSVMPAQSIPMHIPGHMPGLPDQIVGEKKPAQGPYDARGDGR